MALVYADLHIHSILSPCADRLMIPQNIYSKMLQAGINTFAVCDHNSTKNVRAFYEFGRECYPKILFLPGIEIETEEEVHIVGLFPNLESAETVGEIIRETLKEGIKKKDFLEPQSIINSRGEIIGEEEKALYLSSELDLESAVELLHKYDAIAIASHIDRPSFSVTSQLGFIPENLFDALEISPISVKRVSEKREFIMSDRVYTIPDNMPIITSTDSHSLDEIGQVRTLLNVEELTFEGIKEGIKGNTYMEVGDFD